MIYRLSALVLAVFWFFTSPAAVADDIQATQTIKLERFRKALWTVRVTLNGKTGDFLFDTGGGITLVTEKFAAGLNCKFWGRVTGYNMFGERAGSDRTGRHPLAAAARQPGLIPQSTASRSGKRRV